MTAALLLLAAAILSTPGALRARTRLSQGGAPIVVDRDATEKGLLGMAFSLDVLSVCLRSGMPVATAAVVVSSCAPPELARILNRAGEMLALGAPASAAWADPGSADDLGYEQRQALTRLARRSADSGAVMAEGIASLAVQCRRDAVDSAVATAERAGVLIGAPLGLCFLPSFVCLGIVPVVMGLANDVFNSGVL
ncbi:type II secretion system F family protein [Mycobacteroides salmoniphilum]|uniref:Bacterial type II secretion system protein F domain protein n=1 Tax=Mycobacteroides salmoniphilum TaxID=404941 RepID=A0A4R8SR40_9MYCO|nr:type II secretion system F family protein [Mycobacteroides salmoniphilum]TDZ95084.1 Bacterial type II secretion system protein F domain protein [Mycobacteroides salmoniphilum]TEA02220.1 Bacterial type II secretion system protein F domain protein [Mycobacteroides salmoniphilum]